MAFFLAVHTDETPAAPNMDMQAVNSIINNLLSTGNQELIAKLSGATETQEIVETVINHFANSGPSTNSTSTTNTDSQQTSAVLIDDNVTEIDGFTESAVEARTFEIPANTNVIAPNSFEMQRNCSLVEESISIISPTKSMMSKMRSRESSIEVQEANSDDADRDWTFVEQKRRVNKANGAIPKGVTVVDSSSDEEIDCTPVAPAPAPRADVLREQVIVPTVVDVPPPQVDGEFTCEF